MTLAETQREHTADEVKHLKACVNDLISILALPAMWAGHDPSRVTTTLLDMLVGTLDLDFAYVRANDLGDGSSKEWIRSADGSRDIPAEAIGRGLAPYLTRDRPQTRRRVAHPVAEGTVSITVLHLGIRDNVGVFVAGSRRSEFPTETERLLLQVATNQAAIALQEARSAQEERSRAQAALQEVEQRFRMMADSISEVIWVRALEPERVLYTSPSFERIWGLSLDDLYRNQCLWTDAVHPEDRERVNNTSSLWMAGPGVSHHVVEYRIVRPDGDVRWIHERGVLERDENGKPVGVSGISTDITERKRGEEALRRSEAYLAAAQKLSHTGSFGWDLSTGELHWSEETFRIFEFDPTSKVTIDRILQRTHPEDRSTVRQVAERVSRERTEFDFEHRLLMPDGSVKFLRVVGCPATDKAASSEFVGAITDITERKRAEEVLQQAQSRLFRATQVATAAELSASVAHEVNQPLAAVVANGHAALRWLSANPPNLDRAREAIDRIVRDGKDAGEVVQRVRSLFGGAVPDTITFDVNELIAEVVGLVDGERARKQIAVDTRLDKNLPPTAGDRVQLQQVILNLLLNGIEAMDTVHDRPRRIFIRSKLHQPNSILVEITDNGVGIADPERIFEPFFTTKKAGMGMGLAISRSIIEAHRGRLWAEPGDGVGTTLCFTVPVHLEPF